MPANASPHAADAAALLERVREGFSAIDVAARHKDAALEWIGRWLSQPEFAPYAPQLRSLIERSQWHVLLDAFYQVIPFGTGGRRGPMGIGPNRINHWTIQASAQGHAQYLRNRYGKDAARRGVVLAYDVREYTQEGVYDDRVPNPIKGLTSRALALAAAQVYAANGIAVHLFRDVRSTPELSFAIRHLGAVGGDMFSASHNPPTDSGKKVYDEHGGQLVPPDDQELVDEVTQRVREIKTVPFDDALERGAIRWIEGDIDDAYLAAVAGTSLSNARGARIVFAALHGTGRTSVYEVLARAGFDVRLDPSTANYSGRFEHVTFNIPNPEVQQSFDSSIAFATAQDADVIVSADPDADRLGVMVRHKGAWRYLTGNEIGILLTAYGIDKWRAQGKLSARTAIVKTMVTSALIGELAERAGARCIGDLLVGFKYVGRVMNDLEREGDIAHFLIAAEESHGFLGGNYARDKDSAFGALWLCELAAECKLRHATLLDRLEEIYADFGYCHSYLTEMRLPGAEGMGKIEKIQTALRERQIRAFGAFPVLERTDFWQGAPHVSPTDTASRNVLRFALKPAPGVRQMHVTVRPSGTEPKVKMYFEILGAPAGRDSLALQRESLASIARELEKALMGYCYGVLGIDFPERGYLLFEQLPVDDKLRYFTIEDELASLREIRDVRERRLRMERLLAFLGSDPIAKIDTAFRARFGAGVLEHLELA